MARISYVCTVCTQNFTRRYSANRHNVSFHPGQPSIVRVLDYLVGTTCGRYPPPNPLVHPRQRRRTVSQESYFFKPNYTADSLAAHAFDPNRKFFDEKSPKGNNDGMQNPQYEQQYQSHSSPNPPAREQNKLINDLFAFLDRPQEARDKLLEIKKILDKVASPLEVKSKLAEYWAAYCLTGNISILDQVLTDARRLSRWNETEKQLNS